MSDNFPVIWKFELTLGKTKIKVSRNYRILHVGVQKKRVPELDNKMLDAPFVWILLDPSSPELQLEIYPINTGEEIPDEFLRVASYIGTTVRYEGREVQHFFCQETTITLK